MVSPRAIAGIARDLLSLAEPSGSFLSAGDGADMHFLRPMVRAGDRAHVRGQPWLVAEVAMFDACALVTLRGLGNQNRGCESRVLAPFDRIEPVAASRALRHVRSRCWRRACAHLIAEAGDAGSLHTAPTARMELLPHQLEPALAVVSGRGSRVLIADAVGLGKTVQAALIVSELLARGAAARVLVLAPAGLRDQWAEECRGRFGLDLRVFDAHEIRQHRRHLPTAVNPWSTLPLIAASIDYVKRPEVLPAVRACHWDVVIVDEAHHVAAGNERHDGVAAICRAASYVVILTATPHNGDARAFASLCAIGQHGDDLLTFRRTRRDIGGRDDRRVHQLRVGTNERERQMHRCLAAFVRAVGRERGGHEQRPGSGGHGRMDPAVALAIATLRKRALSSAFALARSVARRLRTLAGERLDSFEQLTLPLAGDAPGRDELDGADEPPAWTIPALRDPGHEQALLSRLLEAAEFAVADESKLRVLSRLLRRLGEPALVFTEYRDTLMHVRDRVAPEAAVIHGGLSTGERRASLERFAGGSVLLATDAAGEGLNLHQRCRVVINLELPWSPVRLEQRIGRVDRIGQRRRVHVFHLIAAGTGEAGMLERLAGRVSRANSEIGSADPLASSNGGADGARDHSGSTRHVLGQLREEAATEWERLVLARRLTTALARVGAEQFERAPIEATTLVARSTKGSVRAQLQGRTLVVVRSVLADRTGRVGAFHLTPLLVRLPPGHRLTLQDLRAIESAAATTRAPSSTARADLPDPAERVPWLERSLRVHRAFWRTRIRRELALAGAMPARGGRPRQRGLFDLRTEQDSAIDGHRRQELRDDAARRLRAARSAAQLEAPTFQTALVLSP